MTPLRKAITPPEEHFRLCEEMIKKWQAGHPAIRQAFPETSEAEAFVKIFYFSLETWAIPVWMNETYQVAVRRIDEEWFHLSIKRNDREPIRDWREFQQIKNQILGEECEAMELYPAESRLVDTANSFHLFGTTNPKFRFPVGFQERLVTDEPLGKSKNRKL